MAWVTKDSVEQYNQTPEPQKQYTKKEKAANWWHYNKLPVAIALVVIVLVVWVVHDVATQVRPDYRVGYVGRSDLPVDTVAALENVLAGYVDDRNGDGKVVVQLVQYNADFSGETENTDTDPYSQMAGITRLSADLASTDGPFIYLMQNAEYAEQFEDYAGALQYLDGTMPEEDDEKADWTKMVYRWTDCPVLMSLDLGTYTGLTLLDDTQGESQDIMKDMYIGRRVYYDEKNQRASEAYDSLWNSLTAGAVSTAGQQ